MILVGFSTQEVRTIRAKGAFVVAAAPVWAHHAFTAEFDADSPIELGPGNRPTERSL